MLEKTLVSPLDCKQIQPVHSKGDQSWMFIGRTDGEAETLATWWEELTHLKSPWCWERLKAGGEGDDRDGWMASPTQWTWVWVNSGSWWWTGRPGVLRSMGSQRVGHDWATELNSNQTLKKFEKILSDYASPAFTVYTFLPNSCQWARCVSRRVDFTHLPRHEKLRAESTTSIGRYNPDLTTPSSRCV